jgi:hypothetical protein
MLLIVPLPLVHHKFGWNMAAIGVCILLHVSDFVKVKLLCFLLILVFEVFSLSLFRC